MPKRKSASGELTEVAIISFRDCKNTINRMKAMADQAEAIIITNLINSGRKSTTVVDDNDVLIKAVLVEGSRITIDEDRLKKHLGSQTWGKVTKRVIDKAKLEDAIASGLIDANVVAQCSDEQPTKGYIRITEHGGTEAELDAEPKPVTKGRKRSPAAQKVFG